MSKSTRKALAAQAVQQAMEQHDGLAHTYVRRQGGGEIPYEEALQAGRIGLWRAIQGYDPARGTTFSTYAWVAISRHVHRRAQELNRDTAVGLPERLFGNFRGSRPDNASMLPHPGGAGPGAPIRSSEQVFATENPKDPSNRRLSSLIKSYRAKSHKVVPV